EVAGQIGVDHVGVAPAYQPAHFFDRVHRSADGAVAVDIILEVRLEDWFQHEFGGSLHHPIPDGRNAERSLAATRLSHHHPPAGGQADRSSKSVPRAGPLAPPSSPTLRLPRSSFHPHPLLPH